jgi:hypothetical protein
MGVLCPLVCSCAGSITEGEVLCDFAAEGAPPETPDVLTPSGNLPIIANDDLVIGASPFVDPDGDAHKASEFEIWTHRNGVPLARVWHAAVTETDRLSRVTIADGEFDAAPEVTTLGQGVTYGVRVRYRDASSACKDEDWSQWSKLRTFTTDDGSSYLFDATQIREFHLEIPPESWEGINAEAVPPDGCKPHRRSYYPGTLRFEDQLFEGVGIRVKGGCGSGRTLDQKAGFKVNLSWDNPNVPGCPQTRRLYGLKRLTFNNMVQDETFSHERLGYPLYRAMGVAAPRTAHARLYVNGEFWGLYLLVDSIDRRFLSHWFASNDGMLYEGTYYCDVLPSVVNDSLQDTGCFSRKFTTDDCSSPDPGADPADFSLLQQLARAIDAIPSGEFYPAIDSLMAFDSFMSLWAVDTLLAHWDGYSYDVVNNYRLYHDPSADRWSIIPTGIDQTFRDTPGDRVARVNTWSATGIIARRCLDEPDCRAALAARMIEVLDVFEGQQLVQTAMDIEAQISPHVRDDPRKPVTETAYSDAVARLRDWISQRPDQVRSFLRSQGYLP